MSKITVIIPTLNEETRVEKALQSAQFADEIIVIDSFSTDNTIAIAKEYNARVYQRKFDDFSSQKNYAIDKATNNWIVWVDADEVLPQELQQEIVTTVNNPNGFVGFYIYRVFYFKGKKIRYSGTQNDKLIRVFNREHCHYEGLVHEKIITKGKIGVLKNKMLHYSYVSFDQFVEKLKHYATLKAKEDISQKNILLIPYQFIVKPVVRFFIHYVIKLGFLDGLKGFIVSLVFGYGVFIRYVKLWFDK